MVFPEFIREYHFHNRFKKLFLLKSGLKLRELETRRAELLGRGSSFAWRRLSNGTVSSDRSAFLKRRVVEFIFSLVDF